MPTEKAALPEAERATPDNTTCWSLRIGGLLGGGQAGGGRHRGAFCSDQFGPVHVPIVRAQIPSPHQAPGCSLNWHAAVKWHRPRAARPTRHVWCMRFDLPAERSLAALRRLQELGKLHGPAL